MNIHLRRLSRRDVIRRAGGAAVLLLPVLRARKASAANPVRLLTFYYGNGPTAEIDQVFPARKGNGWDWSASGLLTKALAPHESYLSIVRGLWMLSGKRPEGSHGGANVNWSTGSDELLNPTNDHHLSSNVSIDQWFADQTKTTKLYLGVAVDAKWRTYRSSYSGRGQPSEPEQNVARAYDSVFSGVMPGTVDVSAQRRESKRQLLLLDAIYGDLKSATRAFGLGYEEKQRLERYEAALVDMEKSVREQAAGPSVIDRALPAVDRNVREADVKGGTQAMLQIAIGALALGLRRACAFQLSNGFGDVNYAFAGGPHGHHGAQHSGNETLARKATVWIHEQVAWVLSEMRKIDHGGGRNLLDDSVVMVGTDCPHGADHNYNREHPSLLFGKAGGRLRGNVEARPPVGTPWVDHACWLGTIGEALKVTDNEFARRTRATHMFRELLA